jgi:type II secretory pathway pseudopilin PulG
MVELMLALAISAMLLTSVALAFRSSVQTAEENQKVSTVTQLARVILNRLITESRQADDVDLIGTPTVIATDNTHSDYNERWVQAPHVGIAPALVAGKPTALEYELLNSRLYYRQTVGGVQNSYTLIGPTDNVSVTRFTVILHQIDADKNGSYTDAADYTEEVIAEMTVQVDGNLFAATASTNPRRALEW